MRASRNALTLLVCGALVFGLPAVAPADPGTPGLDNAATAAYPRAVGPTLVAGREQGPGPENVAAVTPTEGGGGGELPFTGLAAVLVLGAAVTLLAGGGLIRLLARQRDQI